MQAFLEYVIKALVDRPDAVALTQVDRNGATVYELRVHPTDMGKIIGRQGATINAIRSLLLVGSAKQGLRCSLEVIDEEGGPAPGNEGAPAAEGSAPGDPLPPQIEGQNRPFRPGFRGGRGGAAPGPGGGYGGGGGLGGRGPSRGGPRRGGSGGGGFRGGGARGR